MKLREHRCTTLEHDMARDIGEQRCDYCGQLLLVPPYLAAFATISTVVAFGLAVYWLLS